MDTSRLRQSVLDLNEMSLKFYNNTMLLLIENKRNDNNFFSIMLNIVNKSQKWNNSKSRYPRLENKCTINYHRNIRKYDIISISGKDSLIKTITDATELY